MECHLVSAFSHPIAASANESIKEAMENFLKSRLIVKLNRQRYFGSLYRRHHSQPCSDKNISGKRQPLTMLAATNLHSTCELQLHLGAEGQKIAIPYSYLLTRLFIYVQWLFTFLSVARIGLVAFELEQNRDLIQGECLGELNSSGVSIQGTAAAFYCNTPIDTFILIFIVGLTVDWVLNGYLYFVIWRFYTRMQLYPESIKGEEFTYEEGLDEL
ncbi:hypothetical protein BGZ46_010669 [Entomortierella lignicola]|nr:hypothetical protein BGZ46_010669 [Entomortierella lignicola]